jgi:dipeptidase
MRKGALAIVGVVLVLTMASAASAFACTTMIVGKDATADGSVLIAHTEDLGYNSAQVYKVFPATANAEGSEYQLYSGGSVPNPPRTQAYFATSVFDKDWIPGDITSCLTEHQIAIYNNMTYSREYPHDPWEVWPGGVIWTEFNELAAQQVESARQAVAVMGALSEAHWLSADPGTSFAIADANEGWWIEIARGGQWVAERVPDDGAVMHANCFAIDEVDFDDPEKFMWSSNVIGYAQERGWYDPASGEPFSWKDAYSEPGSADWDWNSWRVQRVQPWLDSLIPNVTKEDIMAILRDHYEGTSWDFSRDYQVSPHGTKAYTVCNKDTEVGFVTQLRSWMPAEIGAVAWISMKTPCSSTFVPWYMGTTRVPKPYMVASNKYVEGSAWWAFHRLMLKVDRHYRSTIGIVRERFDALEARELTRQAVVEAKALELYRSDPAAARAYLTRYSNRRAVKAYQTALDLFAEIKSAS